MTPLEIETLFKETIELPEFKAKSGATKQQLYNYRNRTSKISLMLEILLKVDAIKVIKK
ncbi:hypothetical protein [Tenacibaculum soleae]|uniref:hypothetical protein n=1 Tax=Tenacibaculum soleae TaxID=447689 RepID=UPI0023012279|nr:hypothetical protein [Tenacibaculum soleae]